MAKALTVLSRLPSFAYPSGAMSVHSEPHGPLANDLPLAGLPVPDLSRATGTLALGTDLSSAPGVSTLDPFPTTHWTPDPMSDLMDPIAQAHANPMPTPQAITPTPAKEQSSAPDKISPMPSKAQPPVLPKVGPKAPAKPPARPQVKALPKVTPKATAKPPGNPNVKLQEVKPSQSNAPVPEDVEEEEEVKLHRYQVQLQDCPMLVIDAEDKDQARDLYNARVGVRETIHKHTVTKLKS